MGIINFLHQHSQTITTRGFRIQTAAIPSSLLFSLEKTMLPLFLNVVAWRNSSGCIWHPQYEGLFSPPPTSNLFDTQSAPQPVVGRSNLASEMIANCLHHTNSSSQLFWQTLEASICPNEHPLGLGHRITSGTGHAEMCSKPSWINPCSKDFSFCWLWDRYPLSAILQHLRSLSRTRLQMSLLEETNKRLKKRPPKQSKSSKHMKILGQIWM